jgi:hypothetical protein
MENQQLLEWLADTSKDPYAFVMGAFPWGDPDSRIKDFPDGPEEWQKEILEQIRDGLININKAIQLAVASGHGVGKTALVSWIILWAISTKPDTRGVITANTETQLKTKTWAELGKWYHMFLAKDFFSLTATALFAKDSAHERTWRIDMVPWSERNTEAFAGLHNKGRRIVVVFDEASAIPDIIWETTEGALTDAETEIVWCVFGNPTRNTGRFRECFPGQRHSKEWRTKQVDSREVTLTNKDQIRSWIEAYGEDSDFVRIRVRGIFPRTGEMEFISAEDVEKAANEEANSNLSDALVIGVDVARYGANETVIFFRKGRDARTIPPVRLRGASVVQVAAKVSEVCQTHRVDGVFIDGGGVGGGVVDNVRALHIHCFDIQFGSKPESLGFAWGTEGERYANKRAEMWGSMRQWLKSGAIPYDADLKAQLVGPTYTYNLKNEILLEKKEEMMKRGLDSPDLADALALTFAMPVIAHQFAGGGDRPHKPLVQSEYNPFATKNIYGEMVDPEQEERRVA